MERHPRPAGLGEVALTNPGGADFLVENVFAFRYAREVDAVTCIESRTAIKKLVILMFALMIFGTTVGATIVNQGDGPTQSKKKIK